MSGSADPEIAEDEMSRDPSAGTRAEFSAMIADFGADLSIWRFFGFDVEDVCLSPASGGII
jgi:hypothetical protein